MWFFKELWYVLILLALSVIACNGPVEQPVVEIPLTGELMEGDPEVSGLAWYGEELVLLSQYPDRFRSGGQDHIFAIPKEAIQHLLESPHGTSLSPRKVPFDDRGISDLVDNFEGYEALVFVEDRVFLTIEAVKGGGRIGYLVSGGVEEELSAISLDVASIQELTPTSLVDEMAFEALLSTDHHLIPIYEANGKTVNSLSQAVRIDRSLQTQSTIPFPSIEYRITDATSLDEDARFWAINYFYPGEEHLKPRTDPVVEKYGQGPTHAVSQAVERLVEFQWSDSAITLVDRPPVQFQLLAEGESRNWEGIVRLDDKGFLVITDTYPETILAFIPMP
ncbi:MAG: hypothetical protein QF613_07775 [Candidatus Marinimicrobia bacterium]|jgi:hypothetical protein|nr:hypothetical protein [Candidatus Neomarinimicrobiota bacterium]MDP6594082.1 hypothetical protein [Candidatus Neomarinimicrobiota bacterium]MDP6837276.1 hypothetical protein [Candidatus Neomarinimicrobiota bacterium]|tara:strand:+ start:994 stop:1998 length:1005 start_codon:yes stop_codon:yes gene_type:complete